MVEVFENRPNNTYCNLIGQPHLLYGSLARKVQFSTTHSDGPDTPKLWTNYGVKYRDKRPRRQVKIATKNHRVALCPRRIRGKAHRKLQP